MPKQKTLKVPPDFPVHIFKPLQQPRWDASGTLSNEKELTVEYDMRIEMLGRYFNCPPGEQFYDQLFQKVLFSFFLPTQRRGPGRRPSGEAGASQRQHLLTQVELLLHNKSARSDVDACKILHRRRNGFEKWTVETLRKAVRVARQERLSRNQRLAAILKSRGYSGAKLLLAMVDPSEQSR